MRKQFSFAMTLIIACSVVEAHASKMTNLTNTKEYLVKLVPGVVNNISFLASLDYEGSKAEVLFDDWILINDVKGEMNINSLAENKQWVEYVQPNYKIHLLENYKSNDPKIFNKIATMETPNIVRRPDNPSIPSEPQRTQGLDPFYSKQWGMIDNHVKEAWKIYESFPLKTNRIVVAVIDTGVDYTHEDLLPNLWRNSGEIGVDEHGKNKESNGIDDDNNGYIDDVIGWDFVSNDNKPYDLAVDPLDLLKGGGNPGHGTHCAGNVGAASENGKGIVGVSPFSKIMAIRFISEKGTGTTADAIKAIKYAVDNGAQITSNSWGSEGEDPNENVENKALRDAIQYAQDKGTLFIAAAGNGHQGIGYNNDTDAKPSYPSSYDFESIISVAAIDNKDQLGSFSNWGARSVDIGAPGVKVFSTTVGNNYSDAIFEAFQIYWDGTSMATPHVAGAAALYWSAHPEKDWRQVKEAILKSAQPIAALQGKSTSNGKLNVLSLMKVP